MAESKYTAKSRILFLRKLHDFIKQKRSNVLFSVKPIIDKLKGHLPEYEQETGIVGELMEFKISSKS